MFKGYKTYITAALAIVAAIAAYMTGDASVAQTGQLVFSSLLAAFIRDGIKS